MECLSQLISNPTTPIPLQIISYTYLKSELTSKFGHYGKKASTKKACNKKGRDEITLPLIVVLVR
jgi:hypothetical protein